MKKLALVLGFMFIGLTTMAQDKEGVTITLTIENVLSDGGTILTGLHTADTFLTGHGVASAIAPAKAGEIILTFKNVQPGIYAIMAMHDANDNKRMDMDSNGMPKESYGSSGEMNMYGPPSFEASKFEVTDEDMELKIRF